MMTTDRFGELRSILQHHHINAKSWHALTNLVSQWPDMQDHVIPYAIDHLNSPSWGALKRTAPQRWFEQISNPNFEPQLFALANEMVLNSQTLGGLNHIAITALAQANLSNIQTLNMQQTRYPGHFYDILTRVHWTLLTTLSLRQANIHDDICQRLAQWQMPNIDTLDISINTFGIEGMRSLTDAGWWSKLKKLTMGHGELSAQTMQHLSNEGIHAKLEALHIRRWIMDWPTVNRLAAMTWTHTLETLELHAVQLDLEAMFTLFFSAMWPKLQHLNLSSNQIGTRGIDMLGRTQIVRQLTSLNLSLNGLNAHDIIETSLLEDAQHLQTLILSNNPLGDQITEVLPHMPCAQHLIELNLGSTRIKDISLVRLTGQWTQLETLTLDANVFGPDALLLLLGQYEHWPNLEWLSFRGTQLKAPVLGKLAKRQKPVNLTTLDLRYNTLTSKDVAPLEAAWPDCRILF